MPNTQKYLSIPNSGPLPRRHEFETYYFLMGIGKSVEIIPVSLKKGIKNPDIRMDGKLWEIKSPIGVKSRTLENAIRAAAHQSPNIIIDLRRLRNPDGKSIRTIRMLIAKKQRSQPPSSYYKIKKVY